MTEDAKIWRLHARDSGEVIADLVVSGGDFPWLEARVEAKAGFEAVRDLFEIDLVTSEAVNDDDSDPTLEAAEAAQDRIGEAMTMSYPDGTSVPEFLLHIEDGTAYWRWSDEPFSELDDEDHEDQDEDDE